MNEATRVQARQRGAADVTLRLHFVGRTKDFIWLRDDHRVVTLRRDQITDNEDGTYTMAASLAQEKQLSGASLPVLHTGVDITPASKKAQGTED